MKIKTIVDELSAVGYSIDESDRVTHTLDGLPEEYDHVVMNVAAANLKDSVPIHYVNGFLLNMEMRLARHRSNTSVSSNQTTTALFMQKEVRLIPLMPLGEVVVDVVIVVVEAIIFATKMAVETLPITMLTQGPGKSNDAHGSSSARSSSQHPNCQICNKGGNTAIDCYHRMDHAYQSHHPPARLTAGVASNH